MGYSAGGGGGAGGGGVGGREASMAATFAVVGSPPAARTAGTAGPPVLSRCARRRSRAACSAPATGSRSRSGLAPPAPEKSRRAEGRRVETWKRTGVQATPVPRGGTTDLFRCSEPRFHGARDQSGRPDL